MKVLVCDEHQLFAEAMATVLRRRGDMVAVTRTPAHAVAAAAELEPDVCLIDRSFHGDVDGVRLAEQVGVVCPATRVILLCSHIDVDSVSAALGAGVRGVQSKSSGLRTILEAVDDVLAGAVVVARSHLEPTATRATRPPSALTGREQEVLERIVRGESTRAMAGVMGVSYSTARTHTHSMMTKLGVQSRLQAVAFAVQHGLLSSSAWDDVRPDVERGA